MKIIALVKQVPDTAGLTGSVDGLKLMEEGGPRIVNPWDEYALEAAIQLKEAHGGRVTVLSMGRPEAVEALKRGLAMGADGAVLVSDPALEGSDSLITARVLVAAIRKVGEFDMVVAGRSAIDGNSAATAVQVAALLDVPQVSYVARLEVVDAAAGKIAAVRLLEGGMETVSSRLPAVISVVKEINEPRYPSFMGIRRAASAEISTWGISELGFEPDQVGEAGSQVRWPEVAAPEAREARVEMIEGPPEEAARTLVDRLVADGVV